MTYLLWLLACIYLMASCLIGMLSLVLMKAEPREFDQYRFLDNPWRRAEIVASVMLLGPIAIPMLLINYGKR